MHFCSNSFSCFLGFLPTSFPNSIYPLFCVLSIFFQSVFPFPICHCCFPQGCHWCKLWESSRGAGPQMQYFRFDVQKRRWECNNSGPATLCRRADVTTGTLQRKMNNHSLPNDIGSDHITVRRAFVVEEMKSNTYQGTFQKTEEVPSSLADVYSANVYEWNSQTLTKVAPQKPPCSCCPPCAHPWPRTTNTRSSSAMKAMRARLLIFVALMQLVTSASTSEPKLIRSKMCSTLLVMLTQRVLLILRLPFAFTVSIKALGSSMSSLYGLLSSPSTPSKFLIVPKKSH